MLFHSSFRAELSRYFWATLVVLVSIVMTVLLIRTLGQASRGNIDPREVTLVLGYTVLGNMHTIITMSSVHCFGSHFVAHVCRQRNGDLAVQRPQLGRSG
jgi:hypothetical protein